MIVCDDFVFLHLHKSGGTFVNQLMLRCLPSARTIGYHLPYHQLPDDYRHLPVLGTVRNPWAYYVSWYHFQAAQAQPNPLFLVASDNRALNFNGTIRNLVMLHDDTARIEALAAAFPDRFQNFGLNLTRDCIRTIGGTQAGFYSFLYNRLYRGAAPELLRMEDLRAELKAYLARRLQAPAPLTDAFLDQAPDLNVSRHGAYEDYYSPEVRDLVGRLDRDVIDRHGYAFGG